MKCKKKKELLSSYQGALREIAWLKGELQFWREVSAEKANPWEQPIEEEEKRKLQKAGEEIRRRRRELTIQYGRAAQLANQIEGLIDQVPNQSQRLLLRYRYIDGWTIERIAKEMHYSDRQISNLQRQALESIQVS